MRLEQELIITFVLSCAVLMINQTNDGLRGSTKNAELLNTPTEMINHKVWLNQ